MKKQLVFLEDHPRTIETHLEIVRRLGLVPNVVPRPLTLGNLLEEHVKDNSIAAVVLDMHIRGITNLAEIDLPEVDTMQGEAVGLAIAEQYLRKRGGPFANMPIAILSGFNISRPLLARLGKLREGGKIASLFRKGGDLRDFEAFVGTLANGNAADEEKFFYHGLVGPDGLPLPDITHGVRLAVQNTNALLVEKVGQDPNAFLALTPRQFEEVVAELLARRGYSVELSPPTRDGGFDIYAARNDELGKFLFLVECKRYTPPRKVGISVIRSLHGVVQARRANAGIVVTTSSFTREAHEMKAQLKNQMHLTDFVVLRSWLETLKLDRQYRKVPDSDTLKPRNLDG